MFWLDMSDTPKAARVIRRKDEQERFSKALTSAESEFIAVYGRRRVGKTFLIREFFGPAIRFELTGMQGVSLRDQLANFAGALAKAKGLSETLQPPATWQEAFAQFERHIESLGARRTATVVTDAGPVTAELYYVRHPERFGPPSAAYLGHITRGLLGLDEGADLAGGLA